MPGNVSIRLSIQDAELVRAALEKLGTDGDAALKKLEAAAKHPSAGLSAVDKTVADLKSRVESSGQSLGLLGTFLTGLGPIGLAAAAGIGAAVAVIYEMARAANELASRATAIVNFSEAVGLNTDQLQALNTEGAKFSLNNEQIAQGLQHLASNLEPAHRAQGALYEDLHRINPELAHQIAATKNVADAYDILGRAISKAMSSGDTATANALGRAAFGRNPGQQINLAADVNASGGVSALGAAYQKAGDTLENSLLKRLRDLKTENGQLEQQAQDVWASMFSVDVMERANAMDRALLNMAKHAKELHDATKDETWGGMFKRWAGNFVAAQAGTEGGDPELQQRIQDEVDRETIEAAKRRRGILGPADTGDVNQNFKVADIASTFGIKSTPPIGNVYTALDEQKKYIAGLGSAATPTEQLRLKVLELDAAMKDGNISLQTRNRALVAFSNEQMVAAVGARERLGVATQEEILSAKLVEINKAMAAGYIKSEADKRTAIEQTQRAAEESYRAELVKTSRTPGLTQMGQFQFDDKAADQLATRDLDQLDTTLVNVLDNTKKGKNAWREFGLSATEALQQTLLKALLLAPIAKSLSGMFGMFGGGGGAGADPGMATMALGGIMTPYGPLALQRYASGGIATSPQLALFGEGRQNEAYVPLPDGRAIPAVLYGGNRGGAAGNLTVHGPMVSVTVNGAPNDAAIQQAADAARHYATVIATALVKNYDKGLPARMADINRRYG
jgi:hypothetical protein